ncbi:hypothetical protein HOLleu_39601 [Holothuria leucospilota]|uniref:Uncharacterized protein n=1 Tax=Holothuria leucospilota TaxID=206669 RepID=A0A9Q1BEZ7_HOLLE|nr:hypothetical protein HOLleu_39601 [Holothuria leucospilota]
MCVVNRALAPFFHEQLVKQMQRQPFSLSTDGSNDTGLLKMNPLTVKLFDVKEGVVHRLLDTCTTTGTAAVTVESIFMQMGDILQKNAIPWENCVAVSVDNLINYISKFCLFCNSEYVHGDDKSYLNQMA